MLSEYDCRLSVNASLGSNAAHKVAIGVLRANVPGVNPNNNPTYVLEAIKRAISCEILQVIGSQH